jgi:hypothetical protein
MYHVTAATAAMETLAVVIVAAVIGVVVIVAAVGQQASPHLRLPLNRHKMVAADAAIGAATNAVADHGNKTAVPRVVVKIMSGAVNSHSNQCHSKCPHLRPAPTVAAVAAG